MCNPRKVMIHLARVIEEAWRATVAQAATASGEVAELARLTADIPLDEEMGDLALEMLERVMRGEVEGFEAWEEDAHGQLRRDLGDVVLVYAPGSRQLVVEARLTERVSAEARAEAQASGFTVGEVAVEAVGRYYDDGWGGRTRERAEAEAQAMAAQRMDEETEALHRAQHAEELAAAEAQARAAAARQAAEELDARQVEARAALRERLQMTLANAQERVFHTMNRLVGEAYRLSLIQLVRDNGGRVLNDERSGSVINLELELF